MFYFFMSYFFVFYFYILCSPNSQLTVAHNAPDHKQRTLEPPALRWRPLTSYVPLRAEGSESVPAVVCALCATSLLRHIVTFVRNVALAAHRHFWRNVTLAAQRPRTRTPPPY